MDDFAVIEIDKCIRQTVLVLEVDNFLHHNFEKNFIHSVKVCHKDVLYRVSARSKCDKCMFSFMMKINKCFVC